MSEAHQRLHLTQARVEQNLQRISELKEESARLGDAVQRARTADAQPAASAAAVPALAPSEAGAAPAPAPLPTRKPASPVRPAAPGHSGPARGACGGAGPATAQQGAEQQRRRGLHSSLEMEEELKNHWFAVAFVSKLGKVGRATLSWPLVLRLHSAHVLTLLDVCQGPPLPPCLQGCGAAQALLAVLTLPLLQASSLSHIVEPS